MAKFSFPSIELRPKRSNITRPLMVMRSADGTVLNSINHDATGVVKYAEGTISAAAVAALRATPATLVAAPGAGKMLEFLAIQLFLDYTAPAFTESTANLGVKFANGSGAQVSQTIEATGFIDQTADTMTNGLAKIDSIVAKTGCENKALVLHNLGAGEFGNSGGSAIRYKVAYRVHNTGW